MYSVLPDANLALAHKKHKTADEIQTNREYIKTCVNNKSCAELYSIYTPHIKNCVCSVLKKYPALCWEDVVHDSYLVMDILLTKYDNSIYFSYFIQKFFYWSLLQYCAQNYTYMMHEVTQDIQYFIDKKYVIEDQVLYPLVYVDVNKALYTYMSRRSKSGRTAEHLYKYFIEGQAIAGIAASVGITYFSIYQTVSRATYAISQLVNKSKYCSYFVNTDGVYRHPSGQFFGEYKLIRR